MSGKGGGGSNNGKGNNGISGIPAPARKMVQNLKEIVSNFPEHEIYATLKECNMDPDEAVSRLISQDPFHEVKSKREKKKETKDTTDGRPRGANSTSNRGVRVNVDRFSGCGGLSHFSNNDQKKPLYRKENGSHASGGSLASASATVVSNATRQMAAQRSVRLMEKDSPSDWQSSGDKISTVGMGDGISLSLQPSGMQSPWVGVPGQISMADIVKMGKPQSKASHNIYDKNHPLRGHGSKLSETHTEVIATGQRDHQLEEWPPIEHRPAVTVSTAGNAHAESEDYADLSHFDDANQHRKTHLEELSEVDHIIETSNANHAGHSTSAKTIPADDNTSGAPGFDDNLYQDVDSYHHERHTFENHGDEDGVSSMAANLEQLSLQRDDESSESEEDNPSVIIPNHLQLHSPDCLNLSFGSFGAEANTAFSNPSPFTSLSMKNTLEETPTAPDVSSMGHSEARNPDFYNEEHLATSSDESLLHRSAHAVGSYEPPPVSQPEVLQQETTEAAQGNQYNFPTSSPAFTYESGHHGESTFPHSQTSTQMQNLAPFSNVMQAYANSLPGALLASTVQTAREDIPYSPFPVTQSMPTKYANNASLISGPALSMTEALRSSSISASQPTAQALPGASVATGPSLPQHLAVHPYSQPTLPLGPFTNMIGYPFLPQNYTYMPSAFQQAFAGNSTYHQSLAAVLPQFKSSVSMNSLPQSATVGSGYGFGSSTSIPGGNFQLNPPTAPTGTTVGYDDVISSQYKDSSHMISLQQNDNSPMWVVGPGSRSMSAVPANTYYSFQGQNQQPARFRQGQQPSQHFGPVNYPNAFHSQTGISLELQQQNAREMALGGSQGQPAKQSQQLWQNSY